MRIDEIEVRTHAEGYEVRLTGRGEVAERISVTGTGVNARAAFLEALDNAGKAAATEPGPEVVGDGSGQALPEIEANPSERVDGPGDSGDSPEGGPGPDVTLEEGLS